MIIRPTHEYRKKKQTKIHHGEFKCRIEIYTMNRKFVLKCNHI